MDESTEIWIVTSLSIIAALLVGWIGRGAFTYVLRRVTFGENQRQMIIYASDIFQAFISTFMLIVPTYEKCLLVGENLIFQYYLSTFLLTIVYRYILTAVSPNPLSIFAEQWKEISARVSQAAKVTNGDIEAEPAATSSSNGALRRRGGDTAQHDSSGESQRHHKVEQPGNKVLMCIRESLPSFVGLYFGLHAAFKWLHFTWDGYLTTHHTTKTGILKDCIRCLQTGPAQGFIVEAFVTFFLHAIGRKLSQQRFGDLAQSYLVSGILFSLVSTTTLYIFINITGAFANPLLAYALERECLYDTTSVINHVLVYWFGAITGIVAFYAVSDSKHWSIIFVTVLLFSAIYVFLPSAIVLPFVFF